MLVLVVDLNPSRVSDVLDSLPNARGLTLDITGPDAAETNVSTCREEFGTVSALVNNAGIYPQIPLAMRDYSRAERALAVNVVAPMMLTVCGYFHARAGLRRQRG